MVRARLVQELHFGLMEDGLQEEAGGDKPNRILSFVRRLSGSLSPGTLWLRLNQRPAWRSPQIRRFDAGCPVHCVATMPETASPERWSWIVAGCADGTIRVWDWPSRTLVQQIQAHAGSTIWGGKISLAVSADGECILSGSKTDKTAKLWDLGSGKVLRVFEGHSNGVTSVAIGAIGRRIATASWDGTIRIWDEESGELIRILNGHAGSVTSMALNSDSRLIASAFSDDSLRLWEAESGKTLWVRKKVAVDGVTSMSLSADGYHLACASSGGVDLRSTEGGQLLAFAEHSKDAESVEISRNGLKVASGSRDGCLRIWDVGSEEPPRVLKGHETRVSSVALSHDGSMILSGSKDATVRLWNAEKFGTSGLPEGTVAEITSLALSADGRRIASGSRDCSVKIWDAESGRLLRTFSGHADKIESVVFSPAGNLIASLGDLTVNLWDLEKVLPIQTHEFPFLNGIIAMLTADGRLIASGWWDPRVLQLWDVQDLSPLQSFKGHGHKVTSATVSADGCRVASGSDDGIVRLWDMACGSQLCLFEGHSAGISSLALSDDGNRVASGSIDGMIRLWQWDNSNSRGRCLGIFDCGLRIHAVAIDPKNADYVRAACVIQSGGVHFPVVYSLRLVTGSFTEEKPPIPPTPGHSR